MSTKAHHSRSFFDHLFARPPRDYLARHRRLQKISTTVIFVLLCLLVAGAIIYTSDPHFGTAAR